MDLLPPPDKGHRPGTDSQGNTESQSVHLEAALASTQWSPTLEDPFSGDSSWSPVPDSLWEAEAQRGSPFCGSAGPAGSELPEDPVGASACCLAAV